MAQGQIYIRSIKGLLNAIRDQNTNAVGDYLNRNALEMAPLIFGQSETALNDLEEISAFLQNGDRKEKNIILDQIEKSINASLSAQKTPKQTSPSWREIFKNLSWPAKIGYSTLPTAMASFAVAGLLNNAEPNDQSFTPPLDKSTSSVEALEIKQEPQQLAYTVPMEKALPTPPTKNEMAVAIDQTVKEALQEEISPKVTAENFDDSGVEGLRRDEDGQIRYFDWTVSDEVYLANLEVATLTDMPLPFLYAVQAAESSFKETAFNRDGACGLTQFMPATLRYMAYEFAADIGFDGVENYVEKYNKTPGAKKPYYGYRYINNTGENSMNSICYDAQFNVRLGIVNKMRDIATIQKGLKDLAPEDMDYFPVTYTQGYIAVYAGGQGGLDLVRELVVNDGKAPARNSFSDGAVNSKINQKILFHPKTIINEKGEKEIVPDLKNPRSVKEFFELVKNEKGFSDEVLPNYTNWRAKLRLMSERIENTGLARRNIEQRLNPIFPTVRPKGRQDGLSAIAEKAANPEPQTGSTALKSSPRPLARPEKLEKPSTPSV